MTADYFSILDVQPAAGRFFNPDENEPPGTHPVVVISYDLWQGSFAGDAAIVGTEVVLNGSRFTIVGVAPQGFRGTILLVSPCAVDTDLDAQPGDAAVRAIRSVEPAWGARHRRCRPPRRRRAAVGGPGRSHDADGTARRGLPRHQPRHPAGARPAPAGHLSAGERRLPRAGQRELRQPDRSAFDGRGRDRAADRLRQCRQPVAVARLEPAARGRGATGDGSWPRPPRPPTSHREHDDRPAGRWARGWFWAFGCGTRCWRWIR